MADTPRDGDARAKHVQRQEVLADMQFAPIVEDDELTPSEDDDDEKWQDLETVQSAIGVSIGEQQTRLISPRTPAAEKAAALEGTDGGLFFEGFDAPPDDDADGSPEVRRETRRTTSDSDTHRIESQRSPSPSPDGAHVERLPSPWRAGPRTFQDKTKVNDHRSALKQQLQQGSRRRASSGGSMTEAVRKYIHLNLPSMSKSYKDFHFSLPSFSALSLDGITGPSSSERRRRGTNLSTVRPSTTSLQQHKAIPQHDGGAQSTSQFSSEQQLTRSPTPVLQRDFATDSESTIADTPVRASAERPTPRLRRSNSEGSLLVYRTRSFASSLGDDTRFESVQEQVNNRLKAIRDSWQDANFKFPSPTLPNFNFGSRDDMFKSRNNLPSKLGKSDVVPMHSSGTTSRSSALDLPSASAKTKSKWTPNVTEPETESHPFFTQALQELEGDLVILGGYRGSILRSAESPHRQLWVPIKVGLNLRKVDLEVPFEADADERMEESIISSGMLQNIGPIDISKRLFKRLRASKNARSGKLRVHDYGYDWRLSPHLLSRRMIKFLESLPCNQPDVPRDKRGAIVLAHSLGGLITRHAINQRPDLVAGVVYAGVPQRCVNILGPFRNGDGVLFSSRVLTAQVNFSIRTSFALLPLDGKCFINKYTKEEYPVDFFDPKTWIDGRLSPCLGIATPRPAPPKDNNLSVSGIISAMSQALPSFPTRKYSMSKGSGNNSSAGDLARGVADTARNAADKVADEGAETSGMGPQMSDGQSNITQTSNEPGSATAVTIPFEKAVEYLQRVLPEIKRFKEETAHVPAHTAANVYPPIALIYGKSTPTVYGAKVESRDTIKRADAYDELAFASGDGVVLARAAMVPEGYSVTRGGVVSSDRGHITLLGDLEAVGRCLHAVIRARRNGVGMGDVAA